MNITGERTQREFDLEALRRTSYSAARLGLPVLAEYLRQAYTDLTGQDVPL